MRQRKSPRMQTANRVAQYLGQAPEHINPRAAMIADLRIRPKEAQQARAALAGAYQALSGTRVNALAWLTVAHRHFHPESPAGRVASLLAALAPHYSAVHLKTLAAPLVLSGQDTREALSAIERRGLLTIRPTLHANAMELTIRLPGMAAESDFLAEARRAG